MTNTRAYSAARIATRIRELGQQISRDASGRRLDIVVTMDRAFMFAADLIRTIHVPMALHFVREELREVQQNGQTRREVFFADRSAKDGSLAAELKGRDVIVLDAILDSGVTQEFLLRRIGENKPRSLRLAVLLDKVSRRRVALEPDYFAFRTASNVVWSGYGLAAANGSGRNDKNLVAGSPANRSSKSGTGRKKR